MARDIAPEEIDALVAKISAQAAPSGYFLNPDQEFTRDSCRSLIVNSERYGYSSCPCRLASGIEADDGDIVCPCDYRDPDLAETGACFCALYVSESHLKGGGQGGPGPRKKAGAPEERRARRHKAPGRPCPPVPTLCGGAASAAIFAPGTNRPRSARSARLRKSGSKDSCSETVALFLPGGSWSFAIRFLGDCPVSRASSLILSQMSPASALSWLVQIPTPLFPP